MDLRRAENPQMVPGSKNVVWMDGFSQWMAVFLRIGMCQIGLVF